MATSPPTSETCEGDNLGNSVTIDWRIWEKEQQSHPGDEEEPRGGLPKAQRCSDSRPGTRRQARGMATVHGHTGPGWKAQAGAQ